MSALAASLLLASDAFSASERAALDAATIALYEPYRTETADVAVWERDIWSREKASLLALANAASAP